MALTQQINQRVATFRGNPDAAFEKLEFGFDARQLKIIVKGTTGLTISFDGENVYTVLPPLASGDPIQYDFREIGVSRIWVKDASADVEIIAYGQY